MRFNVRQMFGGNSNLWIAYQRHLFEFIQRVCGPAPARSVVLRKQSSRSRQRISVIGLQFHHRETDRTKNGEHTENNS
jgi:hypothetical protein